MYMTEKMVLFVCTGNTCRSPMSEMIAKDYLHSGQAGRNIGVSSAGISAIKNEPASYQAKIVMSEWQLDLSKHGARILSVENINEADIILTMTERHKNHILKMVPSAKDKVYVLKEYSKGKDAYQEKGDRNVLDPFGFPVEYYRLCAKELKEHIQIALEKFIKE